MTATTEPTTDPFLDDIEEDLERFVNSTELAERLLSIQSAGNLADDLAGAFYYLMQVAERHNETEARKRGDKNWSIYTIVDPALRVLIDVCLKNPHVLIHRINEIVDENEPHEQGVT